MRKTWLAVIACLALGFGGCGVVRAIFGITEDPKTGVTTTDGKGGPVGSILNWLIPGAGAVVAAGAGVYADIKRRSWKDALIKTAQGVEAFKATSEGERVWEKLKGTLVNKQGAKVGKLIDTITKPKA